VKLNVGGKGRINRPIAGISLMAYAGMLPLVTGIVGFCLLYPLFKYSSVVKK